MIQEEQIYELLSAIEGAENQARKRYEYDSYQIYEGNLRFYVEKRLEQLYPKTSKMFQVSDYSALKKVVNKKAKAYKEAPKRWLDSDVETELYQDIVKKFSLNEAMKSIDKLFNQHKYCLLAAFFEREANVYGLIEEKWKFIPLAPYEFDVVLGEDGSLQCVILSYPDEQVVSGAKTDNRKDLIAGAVQDKGKGEKKTYAIWTKLNHWVVEGEKDEHGKWSFEVLTIEKNPNNINPYGVLPFVYLPIDFCSEYPVSSPLAKQTVELNAEISTYYTSGMMQIGTLVLKYPSSQAIEFVTQGLFTGMKLPQSENPEAPQTSAEYISPSPNLSGHKEAITTHMSAIFDEEGINSNQVLNPNETFTSGFDRLLSSADVQDIIEDNQGFYAKIEDGIYQIVKAIHRNFIKRDIFKSEELNVLYRKPKVLISDSEKLTNIEKMEQLGLILPWEKLMLYDPNLSEDDAREKWEKIQEARLERMSSILRPPAQEESEDDEE